MLISNYRHFGYWRDNSLRKEGYNNKLFQLTINVFCFQKYYTARNLILFLQYFL